LIVAEARDQIFCIAVDQLIGKQEVVIKNLGKPFRMFPRSQAEPFSVTGRVGLIS
jgi:chemotaxis protein histidine kinase CheA